MSVICPRCWKPGSREKGERVEMSVEELPPTNPLEAPQGDRFPEQKPSTSVPSWYMTTLDDRKRILTCPKCGLTTSK